MFHERLLLVRKLQRRTQKEVADSISVSERNYQLYEYGKSKPSFKNLIALADYFNISLDFLVERTDDPILHKIN